MYIGRAMEVVALVVMLLLLGCGDDGADSCTGSSALCVADATGAQEISAGQLYAWLSSSQPLTVLDVREPSEFASGHIPGALNTPLNSGVLRQQLDALPHDQAIVVYCSSGARSASAVALLVQHGLNPVYNLGRVGAWTDAGYDLEASD